MYSLVRFPTSFGDLYCWYGFKDINKIGFHLRKRKKKEPEEGDQHILSQIDSNLTRSAFIRDLAVFYWMLRHKKSNRTDQSFEIGSLFFSLFCSNISLWHLENHLKLNKTNKKTPRGGECIGNLVTNITFSKLNWKTQFLESRKNNSITYVQNTQTKRSTYTYFKLQKRSAINVKKRIMAFCDWKFIVFACVTIEFFLSNWMCTVAKMKPDAGKLVLNSCLASIFIVLL